MTAFYNEIDPHAAQWLRELIRAGHIAPGVVDERDIRDIKPAELVRYTQCHFFAGIGVWSHALRNAGWPDHRPVWTGSCPCQPFSQAGKGTGFDDERHLWPAFHHLIAECRPDIVFGEQVASKSGLAWIDLVQTDMENAGYPFWAVDTCAAGFGAPHIRQRLWWVGTRVANHNGDGRHGCGLERSKGRPELADSWAVGGLAHDNGERWNAGQLATEAARHGHSVGSDGGDYRPGSANGYWEAADWLSCTDGKWRPVEPGTFPLAHGIAGRVGLLRGYGNAIVAPQAQAFIETVMEAIEEKEGAVRKAGAR